MSDKLTLKNTAAFDEVIPIIDNAREKAFRAVNYELINMYWEIGKNVSKQIAVENWGKSIVKEFFDFIQSRYVGIQGFSASNIWRMKQFYETYRESEKLATLLRELTWSHNLLIMPCKTNENPSVELILCTKKDITVVEYALSRSLSPAMIADYKLYLPDKHILENKLQELTELAEKSVDKE
jgi:hypothetical protein